MTSDEVKVLVKNELSGNLIGLGDHIAETVRGIINLALDEKLPPAVEKSVNKYVNGKIDKMAIEVKTIKEAQKEQKEFFADYVVKDVQWKAEDSVWKNKVNPMVEEREAKITVKNWFKKNFEGAASYAKGATAILGLIAVVAGAFWFALKIGVIKIITEIK